MEAIVLAGGLGTRLKSVIHDTPKPMAPIGDRPFLSVLLAYLMEQGVSRVILSTGYRHEVIEDYYGSSFGTVELLYSRELEPLGTGGAVMQAMSLANQEEVFVVNGDTFFPVDLRRLALFHHDWGSELTLALKEMRGFDRYGTVETENGRVTEFREKAYVETGSINGGVYLMDRTVFNRFPLSERFSLETDFMQKYVHELQIYGLPYDAYFIDIGIPEDYLRAQSELVGR